MKELSPKAARALELLSNPELTHGVIAERVGLSKTQIERIASVFEIRRGLPRVPPELVQEVLALWYRDKMTGSEIGRALGMTRDKALGIVQRYRWHWRGDMHRRSTHI